MKDSKKRSWKYYLFLAPSLLIIVVIFFIGIKRSNSQATDIDFPLAPTIQMSPTSTRPPNCIPIPKEKVNSNPRTPTPDMSKPGSIPIPLRITVTPIPFTKTIDLDPSISMSDKLVIEIYRCNGTYEKWIVAKKTEIASIPMNVGDIILNIFPPASVMGRQPPPPPTSTLVVNPTIANYSIPQSYPATYTSP